MDRNIHGIFQRRNPNANCPSNPWVRVKTTYEGEPDYHLFGALSNTLNYYDLPPISQPKGLPSDLTPDCIYLGDHSFSWLTADEMLAWYDSKETLPYKCAGRLTKTGYSKWDKVSEPRRWRYSNPADTGPVTQSELEAGLVTRDYTHVHVTWIRDSKPELAYFFDEVRRLKEEYGEVRFVFGYDYDDR